jgi:hypothetical protein
VLIHEHKEDLHNYMNENNRLGKQYNMKINIAKTEVMTLAREKQNIIITIDGTSLNQAT